MKKQKRQPTILVDAGPIVNTPRTGVGHYVTNLLKAALTDNQEHQFVLYGFNFFTRPKQIDFPSFKNVRFHTVRLIPGKVNNLLSRRAQALPADVLARCRPQVALFTNYVRTPLLSRAKTVVIIYDLSHLHYRQYIYPKNYQLLQKHIPRSVRLADHIITISETVKRELIQKYDINPGEISVITPAVDTKHFYKRSEKQIKRILKKYQLSENYILYTGTIEPRKNIVNILRAYEKLPKNIRQTHQLVLAGGKGWQDSDILREYERLQDTENITSLGYVDYEDLPALMSGASVFVYPSHYEGFGMPPLEALACETPVVTSKISSLPEATGKAALLVDPNEPSHIARAITRILTNEQLARSLVERGKKRVSELDWHQSGATLNDILKKLTN